MIRIVVILVACFGLCLSMTSCESNTSDDSASKNAQQQIQSKTIESAGDRGEKDADEILANAADFGDYYVEIKNAELAEDYEGSPALIVTYAWTNNSDKTTVAATSVLCHAFQDGVGLDTAIIMNSSIFDANSMTEVRPGTTIDVQAAFKLSNTSSIVEVEVGEWITLEKNPTVARMNFEF